MQKFGLKTSNNVTEASQLMCFDGVPWENLVIYLSCVCVTCRRIRRIAKSDNLLC